jgi:hypothetical protein
MGQSRNYTSRGLYDMWHVWARGEVLYAVWGNLREEDHLEDPGVDGRILKWIFERLGGGGA